MKKAKDIQQALRALADSDIARHSQRFFKAAPGEYGEGDRFLGIRVPLLRNRLRNFSTTPLAEIPKLLRSPFHEERLFALLLLVHQFERAGEKERKDIVTLYLANTSSINNWDLVDSSAYKILGEYLLDKERVMLESLATSACLWERRIAIIATFAFIRSNQFTDTLKLSTMLLHDREDLIQKAVGWMLREVGNRDRATELGFLDEHASSMPRTMLRYAIEKLPADRRRAYLDTEYSGERVICNASSRCE